ncbi:MAG: PDZ domain-containing protein [Planctomycetes bacterium]|nr:PDZ domain-containing protein [Planctomycetota bacterium]
MSKNLLHGTSQLALMVAALVFGAGAVAQAQEEQPQGPVIQIGEADEGTVTPNVPQNDHEGFEQPAAPKYWIGLGGSNIPADHVLRAHVDIPEGQGLLVASVVPDSPAAKAGLKQHDVLLRANEIELHEMHDLVDLVATEGAKKGQIALEVLHHGERETVYLTPEDRPADAPRPQLGDGGEFGEGFGVLGEDGLPKELLQEFRGRMPMEFRNFGPGLIVGGGQGVANIPNGVSVNIAKEDGKPTRITLKRGEETWEVVGDDPESLKQLPEDLRPFVEQLLHGKSPMDLTFGRPGQPPMPEFGDGRLRERLERMEKRMEELIKRFGQESGPADGAAAKSEQTK